MRILVIGGDAAGMSAASRIRRKQPSWQVEVFEMGERTSYALCGLPYYIGGMVEKIDQLVSITPQRFESERGIKVHTLNKVTAIEPNKKEITVMDLKTGQERHEQYDGLLIATGATPAMPPGLNAHDVEGVFYLRSLDETVELKKRLKKAKTAVVIGAGYIGLETAEGLSEAGLQVTLLGREPAPIFEPEIQQMVTDTLEKHKVDFRHGVDGLGLANTPDGQVLVKTTQGDLVADVVVVGVGVRPRSELAEAAGLALGAKKAIYVDRYQRTSDPFIYAAGDCAESYHLVSGKNTHLALALGANRQGQVAGLNIAGEPTIFPGVLGTGILKTFDLALARTGLGLNEAKEAGFAEAAKTVVTQQSKPRYFTGSSPVQVTIIYNKADGRLLGGQIAGTVDGVGQRINTLAAAITAGFSVKQVAELDTAYAPPFSPVFDPVVIACEIAAKG